MKDYLNNKINPGDVVVKIYTKPIIDPNDLFWMHPDGTQTKMYDNVDLSDYWEEIREYEISKHDEWIMATTKEAEFTHICIAEFVIHNSKIGDHVIFAIKGKSDNKDLYYTNA